MSSAVFDLRGKLCKLGLFETCWIIDYKISKGCMTCTFDEMIAFYKNIGNEDRS